MSSSSELNAKVKTPKELSAAQPADQTIDAPSEQPFEVLVVIAQVDQLDDASHGDNYTTDSDFDARQFCELINVALVNASLNRRTALYCSDAVLAKVVDYLSEPITSTTDPEQNNSQQSNLQQAQKQSLKQNLQQSLAMLHDFQVTCYAESGKSLGVAYLVKSLTIHPTELALLKENSQLHFLF